MFRYVHRLLRSSGASLLSDEGGQHKGCMGRKTIQPSVAQRGPESHAASVPAQPTSYLPGPRWEKLEIVLPLSE